MTTSPATLHPATAPLEPGVTLVEASAGTGKTYAIAAIFLRLVLEQRVPIGRILAVTYTVAATAELRNRVRHRLHAALGDLRRGVATDPVVAAFLARGNPAQGIHDLDLALLSFDEAQIFTIHGFCQRILREHAFESGSLFDRELVPDATPLLEEVVQDFWRRNFYPAAPLLARLAQERGCSWHGWVELLQRIRNHPDLAIVPSPDPRTCTRLATEISAAFDAVRAAWQHGGAEVARLIRDHPHLSRDKTKSNFHPDNCRALLDALRAFDAGAEPFPLEAIAQLTATELTRCTKKNGTPPAHPFFNACENFERLGDAFFQRLTHDMLVFARAELPRRKEQRNVLAYEDLVTGLRAALHAPHGADFAATLAARYDAALLDEFQDTDPIQSEIFHRIFKDAHHRLFFIGDPKQAIYGFRGADVFTFLAAAAAADRRFTLTTNYRSEPALLDAVNALFTGVADPFANPRIGYRTVAAPQTPPAQFATLEEPGGAGPLRLRLLATGHAAETDIGNAVAADIARLHAAGARLGGRPLQFSDMAVLVRTNRQARALQERLRAAGIRSVLQTDESVFSSPEALQLLQFTAAVREPGRATALKTALATPLLGLDAAAIQELDADATVRQAWLEKFLRWRALWEQSSFIAMFRHALLEENVRERLLETVGGERALTNLLHLSELLHAAATERRLAPDALVAWLRQQISDPHTAADEHLLRLESDGDAVLLATVHRSKGLEFPVVFCPFFWKPVESRQHDEVLFHDPAGNHRLTFDLRGANAPAEAQALARQERRSEALRLLYVALTRAKNRCYVYAADTPGFDQSPLAHVLGCDLGAAHQKLPTRSGGAIHVSPIDPQADTAATAVGTPAATPAACSARRFSGAVPPALGIASFTSLVAGHTEEMPDRDAIEPQPPAREPASGDPLATLEPGVRTGVFLHDLLEHFDFQTPSAVDDLVARTLDAHGFAQEPLHAPLCRLLQRLAALQLAPGLALEHIPAAARRAEVEFLHPVAPLRPTQLQKVFAQHGGPAIPAEFPAALGRLRFQPAAGFLHGFIDLVFEWNDQFYLIDWKSNRLGPHPTDYDADGIRACMTRHAYLLQYHLYAVALDLFLEHHLHRTRREECFGGVFYVFLRGIDPDHPGRGVFFDRPNRALLNALRTLLTTGEI